MSDGAPAATPAPDQPVAVAPVPLPKLRGPIKPTGPVRTELEETLRREPTRLGEIYLLLEQGRTAEQIRVELGLERPNFVWNYQRTIDALLEGDLPSAPTVALANARKFRKLLKTEALSIETREVLQANLAVLEAHASDEENRAEETAEALHATAAVEAEAIIGVYVYALPHYIRHPYDESGRTLLKVGRSDRNVIERFRNQTRTTALPEEPVLLRLYPAPDEASSVQLERKFHRLLEAADHDRSRARTGGTEWFLTSVKFLDEVAATLGLEIREVFDPGEVDE